MRTRDRPACQSTISKKAKDQERNHASRIQKQTAFVAPEAGESIDQQETLYCRTVFWHNQTLIQNGTCQLLWYGKSQRPSHTEKYLHESEKSSQQDLRGSTIERSNPSKCCITGENFHKKKKKTSTSTKMTCNNCHFDISLIEHNMFTQLYRGLYDFTVIALSKLFYSI